MTRQTKKSLAKFLKVTLKTTKALANVVEVVSFIGIALSLLFLLLVYPDDFSLRELLIWKGCSILIAIGLYFIAIICDKIASKSAYMLGEEQ